MGFFSSLFGEKKSEPVQLPKPPAEKPFIDFMDQIAGVKLVDATDPVTGKKMRVVQRLPRSKEDQQFYDLAGQLLGRAMKEMGTLYQNDPQQIVHFAPFVEAINVLNQERGGDIARLTNLPDFTRYVDEFKDMQFTLLDDAFKRQENAQQETLNRSGYGHGSTASAEFKAALASERALADQQVGLQAREFAEGLYDRDLSRRTGEYGLRENTRQNRFADLQARFGLQKDYAGQLIGQEDRQMGHKGALFDVGNKIRTDDFAKADARPLLQAQIQDYVAKNNRENQIYSTQVHGALGKGGIDAQRFRDRRKGFGERFGDFAMDGFNSFVGGFGKTLGFGF